MTNSLIIVRRASQCTFLLTCLGLLLLAACTNNKPAQQAREAVPVVVVPVVQKDVPIQVKAIGNVEAISTVAIKAQVTGQLTAIYFKEGDFVKKGQLLFTLDKRPFEADLKNKEGILAKDEAQLATAKVQEKRYSGLYGEGVVSKEQTDLMQTSAATLEATVAADRAAVDNARVQLHYCTIYAPIDGRTGSLQEHVGNTVKANADTPMVTINQIQPTYVTFSVPEQS